MIKKIFGIGPANNNFDKSQQPKENNSKSSNTEFHPHGCCDDFHAMMSEALNSVQAHEARIYVGVEAPFSIQRAAAAKYLIDYAINKGEISVRVNDVKLILNKGDDGEHVLVTIPGTEYGINATEDILKSIISTAADYNSKTSLCEHFKSFACLSKKNPSGSEWDQINAMQTLSNKLGYQMRPAIGNLDMDKNITHTASFPRFKLKELSKEELEEGIETKENNSFAHILYKFCSSNGVPTDMGKEVFEGVDLTSFSDVIEACNRLLGLVDQPKKTGKYPREIYEFLRPSLCKVGKYDSSEDGLIDSLTSHEVIMEIVSLATESVMSEFEDKANIDIQQVNTARAVKLIELLQVPKQDNAPKPITKKVNPELKYLEEIGLGINLR